MLVAHDLSLPELYISRFSLRLRADLLVMSPGRIYVSIILTLRLGSKYPTGDSSFSGIQIVKTGHTQRGCSQN